MTRVNVEKTVHIMKPWLWSSIVTLIGEWCIDIDGNDDIWFDGTVIIIPLDYHTGQLLGTF